MTKVPAGRGGLVLYLDFDGVLHHENVCVSPKTGPYLAAPEGHRLFQHAELLAGLLEPYPAVQIVLSTSWSVRYGVTAAAKRLPESLRSRVIGGTYHSRYMHKSEFQHTHRGQQVVADVNRRLPRAWLALDDATEGWYPPHTEHWVQTHPCEGLSDPEVLATFKEKLEAMK